MSYILIEKQRRITRHGRTFTPECFLPGCREVATHEVRVDDGHRTLIERGCEPHCVALIEAAHAEDRKATGG